MSLCVRVCECVCVWVCVCACVRVGVRDGQRSSVPASCARCVDPVRPLAVIASELHPSHPSTVAMAQWLKGKVSVLAHYLFHGSGAVAPSTAP
eukprot:15351318-Alexandrium_andersonii.AAC.1